MYTVRTLVANLVLPDGHFYPAAQTLVTLTDDQYGMLDQQSFLRNAVQFISTTNGASGSGDSPSGGGLTAGGFVFPMSVPAKTWLVQHNLGYFPGGILVFDSSGATIDPSVDYLDPNNLELQFSAPTGGTAYIS